MGSYLNLGRKNKSLCADTPAVSVREPSETIWKIYGSGYAGGLL